jgi:hypothetical protein
MRLGLQACLIAALALAAGLPALEKAGPDFQRERQTSTVTEISAKPLFIYSVRGRRDPFTYDISANTSTAAASASFAIAALELTGFIGQGPTKTALFYNIFRFTTYQFRSGLLYSPEGAPIADVSGVYQGNDKVVLTQGESSIMFTMVRNPRSESLQATMDRERKEPPR